MYPEVTTETNKAESKRPIDRNGTLPYNVKLNSRVVCSFSQSTKPGIEAVTILPANQLSSFPLKQIGRTVSLHS